MFEGKETYDCIANLYDLVRPPYPPELFDAIEQACTLHDQARIVEIGPGTGQATLELLRKCYVVDAVERGANLARLLERKTTGKGQIAVHIAEFETWIPGTVAYDAVFAAASFHWINPDVAYRKCFELLREGGWLVQMWHEYPFSPAPEIAASYEALREAGGSELRTALKAGKLSQRDQRVASIAQSGYFGTPQVIEHVWESRESPAFMLDAFKTQAGYQLVTGAAKASLDKRLNEIYANDGRLIATRHASTAYVARRIG